MKRINSEINELSRFDKSMSKSEFKMRYDPEIGRYVKKHIHNEEIHGEGLKDIFRSVGSKLFGKTSKKLATKAATKAAEVAATKTGEHLGNKAGDKIVQLLSEKKPKKQTVQQTISEETERPERPLTDAEIAERVNQLISGGKIKRM